MDHSPLLADLATDLPQAVRLQRLADHLRTRFHCGAVALLQLEEDHLRPVAVEGLVREALGRRFVVSQHPRLAAILARREVTCFDHDSTLPDPYDGLLDTLVGEPLPVHDCMGVSLQVDGQPWGVLTLDALQTGTFGEAARAALADCKVLVEAAVRISRLEREVQALRSAPHTRGAEDERTTRAGEGDMEIVGQSEPLLRLLHELEVAKLLRTLQNGEIQRLGADRPRRRFLELNRARLGLRSLRLSASAQDALRRYPWPGNIRELEHVVSRAALKALSRGVNRADIVTLEPALLDLDADAASAAHAPLNTSAPTPAAELPATATATNNADSPLRDAVDACQRHAITQALARHQGNWAQAARALEVDASNLHKLARRLGLK
eukprot:gene1382-1353_t